MASPGSADPPDRADTTVFTYYVRLQKVKDHIDQHFAEEITVKRAAAIAGLEQKYFSAFFHAKTGICFKDWVTQIRVDRAMEMMQTRNHSITDVAAAVGFRDLRTLERAFKKRTGMSPRSFKRLVRPG